MDFWKSKFPHEEQTMLERLSSIDWSKLSHAYGRAEDVPQLVRDLASLDEEVHGLALRKLYTNIYHQGTVYQASAYTAPFLIELVQCEEVPERDRIILLLACLAEGNAYHRQHMQYYSDERKHDPAFQRELGEQVFWVDRTHEAVKNGMPTYLRLLEHQSVQIRMSIIHLLSAFKREASQLLPVLLVRLQQESDQRVRACILYGAGVLIKHRVEKHSNVFQLLVHSLADEETELVRLAAAMSLVQTERQDIPSRVFDLLLETIVHPEMVAEVYEELPWAEGRLVFDAIKCFSSLSPSTRSQVVPQLIGVLNVLESTAQQELVGSIAGDIANTLIALTFHDALFNGQSTVEDLTDEQRMVLIAIVNSDVVWKWEVGKGSSRQQRPLEAQEGGEKMFETVVQVMLNALLKQGFPANRRDLRAFLRLAPQAKDSLHFFSRGKIVHWRVPQNKKKELLAELVQLNPQRTLEELKMLIGEFS